MIKNIIYSVIVAIVVVVGFKLYNRTSQEYDTAVNIETVRQIVKLNTMELTDEIVYCDTVDDIGVVYATEIRVVIGFDIENLNWQQDSGLVVIEMPEPTINVYQTGKEQCLDTYHINAVKDFIMNPAISSSQSILIHKRISEHIDAEVVKRDYASKARKTAFDNMQKLFAAMNIKLVERQDSTQTTYDTDK